MAATEDISLRIALDDRQAQAGLDALRQETASLAVTAEGAAGGINAITTKIDRAKAVIEPTATAVNGMASAFGGLNTQTGAVLGGVSNLASAFMAGGPLALGLVAIGTGISWLTTKYKESAQAAQQAERAQKDAALRTALVIEGMTKSIKSQIASTAGYNQAQIEVGKLRKEYEGAAREFERLEREGQNATAADLIRMGVVNTMTQGQKKYNQMLNEAFDRQQALDIELANAEGALREYNQASKALEATQRVFAKQDEQIIANLKAKTKATKEQTDADFDGVKAVEELFAAERKARAQASAEAKKIWEQTGPTGEMFEKEQMRQQRLAEETEKKKTEAVAKAAEERKRIQEQELRSTVSMYASITGALVGQGQALIDDLVTGQENALERFAVNVMREAGTFMLGKGLEVGAAGVANLALGNPAGAGQLAVGGALVAGGIALGAAATGIEHVAINGGQIGQPLSAGGGAGERTTATPMGAGRISTGGTGDRDRGGMEQVTYVFNAPVFGDQNRSARHVAALQRRGQRNLLLA